MTELKHFEDDLLRMVEALKFRPVRSDFLNNLQKDLKCINSNDKVFVPADKTRNVYKVEKEYYEKLLRENITKSYKQSDDNTVNYINGELKCISTKLGISGKIETMATKQATSQ